MRGLFASGERLHVPARVLTAVCAAAVLLSIASLLAGAWKAERDQETALRRYTDAQALLALPPVDTSALEQELAASKDALAVAQDLARPPSVDPSSDAATTLLVRRAAAAGLNVRGLASAPESQVKNGEVAYDVEAIRMTVEGGVSQLAGFLKQLGDSEPGLIPSLTAMTVDDGNVARAEIVFSVYAKVAEPTPVAPPTPGSAR
jgi:hypothetical protein